MGKLRAAGKLATVFLRIKTAVIWRLFTDLLYLLSYSLAILSYFITILSDPLCLSFEIHQMAVVLIRRETVVVKAQKFQTSAVYSATTEADFALFRTSP
jgi:uncharacterized membrane protein YccF (DUF307 family)